MKNSSLQLLTKFSLLLLFTLLLPNCTDEGINTNDLSKDELNERRGRPTNEDEGEELEEEEEVTNTTIKIEAEDYSSMSGIQTQTSADDGTDNVGWINSGDWLKFDNIDLTNVNSINTRVASNTDGGTIEFRLGSTTGNVIASVNVANTGGWQVWDTVSTTVTEISGTNDVYLVFTGSSNYLLNINWFELSVDEDDGTTDPVIGLHAAYAEFDIDETEIYLNDTGDYVIIETTGLPNHTTPYWGEGHELYVEPTVADPARMTPSVIFGRDASTVLTVSANPQLANNTTATGLGTIGIATSGSAIFNNYEGNGPLAAGTASGLDYAGGHIGPSVYHYHLEPKPMTDDDSNLVGVLADGFFIYGRKCDSTGTYPTDLDESGGHVSTTQHSNAPEYHYHIINELFLNLSYLLFEGPFQGTPNL